MPGALRSPRRWVVAGAVSSEPSPSVVRLAESFGRDGFDLQTWLVIPGRYLAVATSRRREGWGPVAMGDTPLLAAQRAWARYQDHRAHYGHSG